MNDALATIVGTIAGLALVMTLPVPESIHEALNLGQSMSHWLGAFLPA
jgi:hypothetical protein